MTNGMTILDVDSGKDDYYTSITSRGVHATILLLLLNRAGGEDGATGIWRCPRLTKQTLSYSLLIECTNYNVKVSSVGRARL